MSQFTAPHHSMSGAPTPYPDVNSAVAGLASGARQALGDNFVGLYLHGSLAAGDFDPLKSDIDALIVTKGPVTGEQFEKLSKMHQKLTQSGNHWTEPGNMEAFYLPQEQLRSHDKNAPECPRYVKGELQKAQPRIDWVIHRKVLRERGIVADGPDIAPMIDPVGTEALRGAAAENFTTWWKSMLDNRPDRFKNDSYQPQVILSVCRGLNTMRTGDLLSKKEAGEWALSALPASFAPAISAALAWRDGDPMPHFDATRKLINDAAAEAARPLPALPLRPAAPQAQLQPVK